MSTFFYKIILLACTFFIASDDIYSQCVYPQCPIVINEVMVSPAGNASVNSLYDGDSLNGGDPNLGEEWIELYNTDPCHTIDIGCCFIAFNTSSGNNWGSFLIPGGTQIPPNGHVLIGGSNVQNADVNLQINNSNHCSSRRWCLNDSAGWVGFYNNASDPIDIVYWNTGGTAADLYAWPEYSSGFEGNMTNCSCCSSTLFESASSFPLSEFAGNVIPNSSITLSRQTDGSSVWINGPVGGTPKACNGGIDSCYFRDAAISFQSPLCIGGSNGTATANNIITGVGYPPYSYLWSTADTTKSITGLSVGLYSVTITDKWGCIAVDTVTITDPIPPVLTINSNSPVCPGSPLYLSCNIPGNSYSWTGPEFFSSTSVSPVINDFDTVNAGTYSLILTDTNNCILQSSVNIATAPLPIVDLGPDTTLCIQQNMTLNASNGTGYSYLWNDGSTAETLMISGALQFNAQNPLWVWVAVNGCKTITDSVWVNISLCDITIPNIITPNGDNFNDAFVIDGLYKYTGSKLIIFNRWGKKVFESSDYQNNWDGGNLADGVYYYILTLASSPEEIYKGEITIIENK